MKFTIKRELLLDALNKVSKAISTKNLIPVLAGIKFDLKKDKLILTASDNDIVIQTTIDNDNIEDFKIENEGSIIIPGKYILDTVRKSDGKYINVEVVDGLKILIYTEKIENPGKSECNLIGISESEYPKISLEESKKKICINSKTFRDLVNQTVFAASNEESKPILNGINMNIVGDILECNSTDSYRLARKIVKLDKSSDDKYNIVVPSRNILEFAKLLTEDDDIIELHIFSNKILFKIGNLKFESRLINGTYPNTSNLLPEDSLLVITTKLSEFYNCIDRVSVLTNDKEKNIVTLETNDDMLILKSSSVEIGRAEEEMPIVKNNKENIKISFSAKYMMEALKSFSTETVDIHFVGEIKPILIKSSEDDSLTQLVLPIRTY